MNRKPYTYSDRLAIETMLNEGKTIKEIECDIKRPSSGIIKEIDKHICFRFPSVYGGQHPCLKWNACIVKNIECYLTCKNIEYKVCPKLNKSPHVCNGCTTKNGCRYVKKYYDARTAHDTYKAMLSKSRTGLHYTEQETIILIEILCPLIIKSKSVYHAIITINNMYSTTFVLKTIYRQIKRNYLPIKSSDLPRAHKKHESKNQDKNYKRNIEGHAYEEYITSALSPAKNAIVSITDATKKEALAVVSDDQLSLAIGKGGNNIKLASRLTKYKISIKTMQEINEEGNKEQVGE